MNNLPQFEPLLVSVFWEFWLFGKHPQLPHTASFLKLYSGIWKLLFYQHQHWNWNIFCEQIQIHNYILEFCTHVKNDLNQRMTKFWQKIEAKALFYVAPFILGEKKKATQEQNKMNTYIKRIFMNISTPYKIMQEEFKIDISNSFYSMKTLFYAIKQ